MALDKDIKEQEEKLKVYKKAVSDTRDELALLRTQKSTEAKKALADYEAKIPELQAVIERLSIEIANLDKEVSKRQEIISAERTNYNKLLQEHKDKLNAEHALEVKKFNERVAIQEKKEEDFRHTSSVVEKSLKEREARVNKGSDDIRLGAQQLAKEKSDFESQRSDNVQKLNIREESISAKESSISEMLKKAEEALVDAKEKLAFADSRANETSAIIGRISEVESREASCKTREEKLSERESIVNQQNVANKAESSRLNARDDKQNVREDLLNQREQNLRELEAKA